MGGPVRCFLNFRRRERGRPRTSGNPVRHVRGSRSDCFEACRCSCLFFLRRAFQQVALGENDAQIVI